MNLNIDMAGKTEKTNPVLASRSADIGSTQKTIMSFRTLADKRDFLDVPSEFGIVEKDISMTPSESDLLKDNLEIELQDLTEDRFINGEQVHKEKMFNKVTIVEGSLLQLTKLKSQKILSSKGKRRQEGYYIQLIAGLGLSLVANDYPTYTKYAKVKLVVEVPSLDTETPERKEELKEKIRGKYSFRLVRYNITIIIEIEDVMVEDEGQAANRTYISEQSDLPETSNILEIDIGGGTSDLSFIQNGILIKSMSKSIPIAGEKIKAYLKILILQTHEIEIEDDKVLEACVTSGFLRDGKIYIDVSDLLNKAKIQMVRGLCSELDKIFDNVEEFSIRQTTDLLLSGRPVTKFKNELVPTLETEKLPRDKWIFRETEKKVYNVKDLIKRWIKSKSPNTEVDVIRNSHAVATGGMYFRLSEEAKALKKTV